jgi:hypothetical protein
VILFLGVKRLGHVTGHLVHLVPGLKKHGTFRYIMRSYAAVLVAAFGYGNRNL